MHIFHHLAVILILCATLSAGEAVRDTRPPDERLNVLLICVDDLRPEMASAGGFAPTPNMDRLAARGVNYVRHYAQVPTCGASRCSMLTGLAPTEPIHFDNGAFKSLQGPEATHIVSLPEAFRSAGYRTACLGKVSHEANSARDADGKDPELPRAWDFCRTDAGIWKNPHQLLHAYASGKVRKPKTSPLVEFADVQDDQYPDTHLAGQARRELARLTAEDKPFFLAVGFYKPHLPFAAPHKWREKIDAGALPGTPYPELLQNGLFRQSGEPIGNYDPADYWKNQRWDEDARRELRAAYAACCAYVDAQIGTLLDDLEKSPAGQKTIIVLWGDHGWCLGDSGLMGKHSLLEEALRAALIVHVPGASGQGKPSERLVAALDIMPTLGELCGVAMPSGLPGQSFAGDFQPGKSVGQRDAVLGWFGGNKTIRTRTHRLVVGSKAMALFDLSRSPFSPPPVKDPAMADELARKLAALELAEVTASRKLRQP